MKSIFNKLRVCFDRSFSKGFGSQMLWLFGLVILFYMVLVGVSFVGGAYTPGAENSENRWYDILYLLVDPGSGTPAMSKCFVLLCAVLGLIIFVGMLISVMSNVLERRVESYLNGEVTYKMKEHVIILGYNRSVPSLLKELHSKYPQSYILLMSEVSPSDIRDWVSANISKEIKRLLVIMDGSRNADDDLARLSLSNNVKAIYIIGEHGEDAHDDISMECVRKLSKHLPDGNVNCYVQLESPTMYSVLQTVGLQEDVLGKMTFLPFDFNEIWAQKALAIVPGANYTNYGTNVEYVPLDGTGITPESKKHVHLVLLGMSEMSVSMAINAAHVLHFPNYKEGDFNTCSHITFIDPNAKRLGGGLRIRYNAMFDLARWRSVSETDCLTENSWHDPMADADSTSPYRHLGPVNFMDIQWEFIEGDIYDANVMQYLEKHAQNENEILSIAFCGDDSEENASLCMGLSEVIRRGAYQLLVHQKESPVLVNTMNGRYGFDNVRPFGMMSACYGENLLSDEYGKLINACYGDYSTGEKVEIDLSDSEHVDRVWKTCSIMDRWSSNYCANMLFVKLRSMGLNTQERISREAIEAEVDSEANREWIQRTEHNRWNTERLLLGVRPLYEEELAQWMARTDRQARKNEKKNQKKQMKHVDICSNERLKEVDPVVVEFDNAVNSRLWDIYDKIISRSADNARNDS